ncbi:PucR family transcriptional regulator [Streptacidiphilus jiangxiensis]|uniref:PucR C-terminal helix-turn-helix domain-containing protein n=1 Tax=Streptacidiphilus jiangxiensis TaxID=235985 RepID=A0A1H7X2G2_STRJI|nr:PucR family transcriptional regulator [Streptacidiphilus jiangxiensis]SEM28062.1 PucR C-terminal helix-turn-helix domain-containing protein [Streptacidiphilus jiangxiensis]
MRIGALLAPTAPPMRLLAGGEELDRVVTGVMTTDLRDPSRYLHGGELVLTGMLWRYESEDSERFVRHLASGGAAGLAAGEAEVGPVPQDLIEACERHRLPLFAVPDDVAFGSVAEYVNRQVSADRAADLSALVDRHRMLVSAASGAGLDAVLQLLGGDVDLESWVLTPTGRLVAGPVDGLDGPEREALVRAHLEAQRRRSTPASRTRVGDRQFSLLPVPGGTPLAQWLLAVEGDITDWTAKRRQLAENLARLVSAERVRRDDGRTLRARLADEMITLLQRDAAPDELLRAMEAAHAMSSGPELPLPQSWVVVSVAGQALAEGEAREAVAEALTGLDDRALVGDDGDAAVVVLPLPQGERTASEVLAELLAPLEAGLGPEGRLTVGVSAPADGVGGLRGALEEARHARRIAAARLGRLCVAGPEELASHVLLLAAVPDEVRRAFRSRLLDRVIGYDLEHQADLVRTLEAFLRYDGSWTRCAAALHVHVNTLRYRIGRIEELTGRDLSRLEDRVDFFLALELS